MQAGAADGARARLPRLVEQSGERNSPVRIRPFVEQPILAVSRRISPALLQGACETRSRREYVPAG